MPDPQKQAGWLRKSLENNPDAIKQSRQITRASVEALWSEIADSLKHGFSRKWVWQTLHDEGMIAVGYDAFLVELRKRAQRLSPPKEGSDGTDRLPPHLATAVPALALVNVAAVGMDPAADGDAAPSSDEQDMAQPAPPTAVPREPLSKHPLPKDAKYFRPSTSEERIERRERARESIARREAEAKIKPGDPE